MTSSDFPHILVLKNAKSTNAGSGTRYIEIIQSVCPEADVEVLAVNGKLADTLQRAIQKDTLLCIIGGDGTVNSVVQMLLEADGFTDAQRRTPVLPLWGGNANDLAHILNGRPSEESCRAAFRRGAVVPIYPLRCTIQTDAKEEVRLAIGYASFGATAHAARHLNEKAFRKNPLHMLPGGQMISEAALSLKVLHDSPTFVIEQNGERKVVFDWIIGKGPRMAKLGHLPVELTDQTFYQGMVERKSLPDVVNRVAGMAWGTLRPTNDKKPITFTTTEVIWGQFDGEPLKVPTHATVTIGLNPAPFYALSTTLKDKKPVTLRA